MLDYVARDADIDDDYTTECFENAENIKQRIEFGDFQFDLLFLEVDENGRAGLELAEFLRERKIDIDVIFIAESAKYITEAFRLRAFNFIVKPVDFEKFRYEMKQYLNEKKNYQKHLDSMRKKFY